MAAMSGKHALIAVWLSGCATALAQAPPTPPIPPGPFSHIVLYLIAPENTPPGKLIVNSINPATAPGEPRVDTSGRIPDFGGILQSYGNTNHIGQDSTKQPFGADVTLPLANRRVEVFSGFGGTYVQFGSPNAVPNTWLTQGKAGARVALDPERHVWLGATSYFVTNFAGDKTRNRSYKSADLTFRFGK